MNTINLDFPVNDLAGLPVPNSHLGKLLANLLAQAQKGPAVKFMDWALALYKTGSTPPLDDTDLGVLVQFVEAHEQIVALAKAPLLRALKGLPKE